MQALRQRGEILPGSYSREDRWGEAAKLHTPKGRRKMLLAVGGSVGIGVLIGLAAVYFLRTPPLCRDVGAVCSGPEDCCGYTCLDGRCQEPQWSCRLMGQQCSHAYECCTYHCNDHAVCDRPPPPCREHQEPCAKDDECCSAKCSEGQCFDPYHHECKGNHEVCERDDECCGFLCRAGQCSDCGEAETPCGRDEECCSYRCKEGSCRSCGEHGSPCEGSDDCCSMFCKENRCEYQEEYDTEHGGEWYTEGEAEGWGAAAPEETHDDDIDAARLKDFVPAAAYHGARHGMVWRTGPRGTGYYPAHVEDIVWTSKQIEERAKAAAAPEDGPAAPTAPAASPAPPVAAVETPRASDPPLHPETPPTTIPPDHLIAPAPPPPVLPSNAQEAAPRTVTSAGAADPPTPIPAHDHPMGTVPTPPPPLPPDIRVAEPHTVTTAAAADPPMPISGHDRYPAAVTDAPPAKAEEGAGHVDHAGQVKPVESAQVA